MKKIFPLLIVAMFVFSGMAKAESAKMKEKLKIVIPKIRLKNVTVEQAIEKLRRLSKEQDPEGEGLNIIYVKSEKTAKKAEAKKDQK